MSLIRKTLKTIIHLLSGAALSLLAWRVGGYEWLSILILPLWAVTTRKIDSFAVMFGYYLTFSMDAPDAVNRFGDPKLAQVGVALWLFHAAMLSIPWIRIGPKMWMQAAIVIIFTALPPFGAFNWAHPFLAAGQIFPGSGIYGLMLAYLMLIWLVFVVSKPIPSIWFGVRGGAIIIPVFLFSATSSILVSTYADKLTPSGWVAENTHFGGSARGLPDTERHIRMAGISSLAAKEGGRVVIFPEEVGGVWSPDYAKLWNLGDRSVTQIVGADMPYKGLIVLNAAIEAKSGLAIASARVPMPVGDWWFTGPSAKSNIFSNNVKTIDGVKSSFIFCYEEFLVYPLMIDSLSGAKAIISMANVWSSAGMPAQAIQRRSIELQARLYGLPLIRAENI